MRAKIQLTNRLTAKTRKRSRAYSPVESGERNTDMKVEAAIIVAPSNGIAVSFPVR